MIYIVFTVNNIIPKLETINTTVDDCITKAKTTSKIINIVNPGIINLEILNTCSSVDFNATKSEHANIAKTANTESKNSSALGLAN